MPYDSFQEYLGTLEKNGCIKWIEEEVDKDWEITSVARNYFIRTKESERRALGFRKVRWARWKADEKPGEIGV